MAFDLFEWRPSTSTNVIDSKQLDSLCSSWINNSTSHIISFSNSTHKPSHFLGIVFFI